ncbi:MAG: IPTL-CTERM sorting domain-containing protein [ANME-2 cluster archaeon]|nr:MAG: IPTL-CTERM sorting domain-containing protein [ANME-2 cluster archaeon]
MPVRSSAAIPTLNEWGLIIFMALAGLGSIFYLRKQKEISS